MRSYFYFEPEVAGGLGAETVMDPFFHPPVVKRLHYEFDGWLGSEVLETFPCYIITDNVAGIFAASELQGVSVEEVIISVSQEYRDKYGNRPLPEFLWMKVTGEPGKDDVGIAANLKLVVSDRVLAALRNNGVNLPMLEVSPYIV